MIFLTNFVLKYSNITMSYIEIKDVVKQYTGHLALDHVSMNISGNGIYGLLGPNGAGKSSLIRIINKITNPDSGEVLLNGKPMTTDDIRNIGYLPEERGLYKKMKVGEQIVYLARLKGMSKNDAKQQMKTWLERFDLSEWENRKVEELSKGMAQKVQFIATVIHHPELLIFDEPFSGFDPVNAEILKKEILRLHSDGATVIFSTHNMSSVEEVCQEISLINKSKVVLQGKVNEIRQRFKKNIFSITVTQPAIAAHDDLYTIIDSNVNFQGYAEATIKINKGVEPRKIIALLNDNYTLQCFSEILPSMNEVFIETVTQ